MKKRLLAVLLALCLALGTLPLSVLAAEFTAELGGKVVTVDTTAKTVKDGDQDVTDYYFIFEDNDTVKYYQGADGGSAQTLTLNALYTVTFNNNDGSETPAASTAKGNSQKTVAEPAAPAREGYTFSKWTTADGGDAITFPYTPTADVTLYAQWTENAKDDIVITFNPNYEGGTNQTATAAADGKVTAPTFQRTDYTLEGWYEDAACTAEKKVDLTSKVFTVNTTLYAKWTENAAKTFTVTFETNGGSAVAAQTVESGKTAAKPADPTKEGSTFGGWFTDADCTAAFDFTKAITANTTVYAKWDAVKTITVTFNANYTGGQLIKVEAKADGSVDAPKVEREFFKFIGWFTKDGKTEGSDGQPDWGTEAPATFTADTTVYAKWEANETVAVVEGTVDEQGKVTVDAESVTIDEAKKPETLVVEVAESGTDKGELALEVSADVMEKVEKSVNLVSASINITIPKEAAKGNKLEVKIDTQAAPASGSTKAAGTVKIEIPGAPQAGDEEQLKTPIVFSLNVEIETKMESPVVAYWNAARKAYVRSRGRFQNGVATFSTRHLTEFAVVDVLDAQPETLPSNAIVNANGIAGVTANAEIGESVFAVFRQYAPDGKEMVLITDTLGGTPDTDYGYLRCSKSLKPVGDYTYRAESVLVGTGKFEWNPDFGFRFAPEGLIAQAVVQGTTSDPLS